MKKIKHDYADQEWLNEGHFFIDLDALERRTIRVTRLVVGLILFYILARCV
jgi:hypothetical protein